MQLLNIENLTKTIRGKTIVDGISMHVNSGEIVGFLGPNGAGKTTTIKMIMGLFGITSGNISVCGHDVKTDFEQAMRNVGGIIENPDLYKRMTGRQNLEYFATMYGRDAVASIDQVADLVKMSDRINDKVKTYSLGMRQRIGLAQAILHMPKLLILDEPTNGLDPIGIKELRDLLKTLTAEAGAGVLVSSHLLAEMELMCTRIYVIDNGRIIGEKEINEAEDQQEQEIFEYSVISDSDEKVLDYLKAHGMNCRPENGAVHLVMEKTGIPAIIADLVADGVSIYAFNRMHRTLEEDFISMTEGSKSQIR